MLVAVVNLLIKTNPNSRGILFLPYTRMENTGMQLFWQATSSSLAPDNQSVLDFFIWHNEADGLCIGRPLSQVCSICIRLCSCASSLRCFSVWSRQARSRF